MAVVRTAHVTKKFPWEDITGPLGPPQAKDKTCPECGMRIQNNKYGKEKYITVYSGEVPSYYHLKCFSDVMWDSIREKF